MVSMLACRFILCYTIRMAITKLGDAQEDFDAWKKVRRSYLSSSEMFSWLDDTPNWWSDGPDDVLDGKRGIEKTFDPETETTIAHGTFDEQNIQAKFGYAVGCNVAPDNGFFVNDRFPGIGASIDGFGSPWNYNMPLLKIPYDEPEVHPELSQDRTLFPHLREYIDYTGEQFITEVKKSLSVKWMKEVPEYYVSQVKTQLSVLEMPYAIIMAETVKKGDTQKWRQFWDFRAYIIERDDAWDRVLEREGKKFLTLLEG